MSTNTPLRSRELDLGPVDGLHQSHEGLGGKNHEGLHMGCEVLAKNSVMIMKDSTKVTKGNKGQLDELVKGITECRR